MPLSPLTPSTAPPRWGPTPLTCSTTCSHVICDVVTESNRSQVIATWLHFLSDRKSVTQTTTCIGAPSLLPTSGWLSRCFILQSWTFIFAGPSLSKSSFLKPSTGPCHCPDGSQRSASLQLSSPAPVATLADSAVPPSAHWLHDTLVSLTGGCLMELASLGHHCHPINNQSVTEACCSNTPASILGGRYRG